MASGDVMLDASGNVILDALGNVLLDDGAGNGCCCGPVCPEFPGGAPAIVRVTIAGTTNCGCVRYAPTSTFTISADHAAGSIEGTYDLARLTGAESWVLEDFGVAPSDCLWGYRNAGSAVRVDRYADPLGSGFPCRAADFQGSHTDLRMYIQSRGVFQAVIRKVGGSVDYWDFFTTALIGTNPPGSATGWPYAAMPATYANDHPACAAFQSVNSHAKLRTGGTVTLNLIF